MYKLRCKLWALRLETLCRLLLVDCFQRFDALWRMSNKRAEIFLSKILFSSALETSASAKQWWFFLFLRLCRLQLLDDIEYGVGGGGGVWTGGIGYQRIIARCIWNRIWLKISQCHFISVSTTFVTHLPVVAVSLSDSCKIQNSFRNLLLC